MRLKTTFTKRYLDHYLIVLMFRGRVALDTRARHEAVEGERHSRHGGWMWTLREANRECGTNKLLGMCGSLEVARHD